MRKKKQSLEDRLEVLEEFHYRVKMGQKWMLCLLAGLGTIISTAFYLLSSWHLMHRQ